MRRIFIVGLIFTFCGLIKAQETDNKIQERLDKGESPRSIIKSGVAMEDLYGKTYEGGYIFYFFPKDTSGLVIGPKDLGYDHNKTESRIIWGCRNKLVGTSTDIGTGMENSKKIAEAKCPLYNVDHEIWMKPAAEICLIYKGGGKDDWYLPSKDELHEAFMNLSLTERVHFDNRNYWTSSEKNDQFSWVENMNSGPREYELSGQSYFRKFYGRYLRPIRSFE